MKVAPPTSQTRSSLPGDAGHQTVVNAVQFPNNPIERKSKGYTFEEVDYKGTVNQVDAAKAAGVKRFVYVSGVGAAAESPYHWFRFKWMAGAARGQQRLDWAVLAGPTWVFGDGDHALSKLVGFTNFLPFLPMFGRQQAMQPVFVEDVARAAATWRRSQTSRARSTKSAGRSA